MVKIKIERVTDGHGIRSYVYASLGRQRVCVFLRGNKIRIIPSRLKEGYLSDIESLFAKVRGYYSTPERIEELKGMLKKKSTRGGLSFGNAVENIRQRDSSEQDESVSLSELREAVTEMRAERTGMWERATNSDNWERVTTNGDMTTGTMAYTDGTGNITTTGTPARSVPSDEEFGYY